MSVAIVCLATAIYFEARDQSDEGQIAVAYSVINRVEHPKYKHTICDVVTDGCHYSFYCDGKSDKPKDQRAYNKALYLAGLTMLRVVRDPTNGATHYHTRSSSPWWARYYEITGIIEDHIFRKDTSKS